VNAIRRLPPIPALPMQLNSHYCSSLQGTRTGATLCRRSNSYSRNPLR
jgi:hypothetical protein